jgi:hypothetical protein
MIWHDLLVGFACAVSAVSLYVMITVCCQFAIDRTHLTSSLAWSVPLYTPRNSVDNPLPVGHLQVRTNDEPALQGHLPV